MRHWILFFCCVLCGCISTPTARTNFPTLSEPPKAEDYIVLSQKETVAQYHAMLTIYHVYLGEYIDFIAKQYKLKTTPDRVRQIEAKALRKIRHPDRLRRLDGFITLPE